MRKRIISMLCICVCILGLAACGTDPRTVDYNGKTYDDLEQNAQNVWASVQNTDLASVKVALEQLDAMSEAERIALMKANEGLEDQMALSRSWLEVSRQVGTYVGVDSFTVTKTGKTTTTDLKLNFEERQAVLSIVYKNRDMSVETITVDLVYTTGEKLEKALLNTVMGMGTVFIMLIVICLIISSFTLISKLEKRNAEKKNPQNAADKQEDPEVIMELQAQAADDLELAAVIAAAIAASTGQSTDDFVVRSIKRR